jgi:hypothetical protein
VELAFFDRKQYRGLHDPRVWYERSVEHAHPMAWFVGTLTILRYAIDGHAGARVRRDRDWYPHKVTPTFTDMARSLHKAAGLIRRLPEGSGSSREQS